MDYTRPSLSVLLLLLIVLVPVSADCAHAESSAASPRKFLYLDAGRNKKLERKKGVEPQVNGEKSLSRHSLQELESLVKNSPEALIAAASMKKHFNTLKKKRADNGWRMNGYVKAGHYREIVELNRTREFGKFVGGGGLRYPLFGRYNKSKVAILDSEAAVRQDRFASKLAEMETLRVLRDHYLDYWSAAEKLRVSEVFLEDEKPVRDFLEQRTRRGQLLDADRQEYLTNFEAVRRNITIQRSVMQRAIRGIRLLTRTSYPLFTAAFPQLPPLCGERAAYKAAMVRNHPQLEMARDRVNTELEKIQAGQHNALEGSFDLGGHVSQEDAVDEVEYGVTMGIVVDLPVHWQSSEKAAKEAAQASFREKQLMLKKMNAELIADAENLFGELEIADSTVLLSRQQLKAADEAIRKNSLRAEYLPGDTIEKLEWSRYRYYSAAINYLDSLTQKMHIHTALLALFSGCLSQPGEEGAKRASDVNPELVINKEYLQALWIKKSGKQGNPAIIEQRQGREGVPAIPPSGFGYYVWNSRKLLRQWQEEHFYQRLSAMRAQRLLISFDRQQIMELQQQPATVKKWRLFIEEMAGHGIAVELLLGEPLWILPRYRQELLEIIEGLGSLSFTGLHLDLEPGQLNQKRYNEPYLLKELLRTLEAVVKTSPWPVGLSLHPRYLTTDSEICLGCALSKLNISEVALMSYIASPEKVSEIVVPIIEQYPDITFSIAQSVEPILTREESHFRQGKDIFWQRMVALQQRLPQTTSRSILIQAFQDFQSMAP